MQLVCEHLIYSVREVNKCLLRSTTPTYLLIRLRDVSSSVYPTMLTTVRSYLGDTVATARIEGELSLFNVQRRTTYI